MEQFGNFFTYVLLGCLFIFVVFGLLKRKGWAREYVLEKRDEFKTRLAWVEKIVENPAVGQHSLATFGKIKTKFSQISSLDPDGEGVDWIKSRRRLASLEDDLSQLILNMGEEIQYARERRQAERSQSISLSSEISS